MSDSDRIILQIIPVDGYEAVFSGDDNEPDFISPVKVFALVEETESDGSKTRLVLPLVPDGYGETGTDGEGLDFCDESSNFQGIRLIKIEKEL